MEILDAPISRLDGTPATLGEIVDGRLALLVNVASRCGLTPQYAGLEELQETYGERGFTVIGFPSNQFGGQEPGSADEIAQFCSATYGVSFPMTEKIDVNGEARHQVYEVLSAVADESGHTGDIRWNFEKFLVAASGEVVARFDPGVEPLDPRVTAAIESRLVPAGSPQ
jgi:glutathione peroxidase